MMKNPWDSTSPGRRKPHHPQAKGRLKMENIVPLSSKSCQSGGRPRQGHLFSLVKGERESGQPIRELVVLTWGRVGWAVQVHLVPKAPKGFQLELDAGHDTVDGGEVTVGKDGDSHSDDFETLRRTPVPQRGSPS